MKYGLVFRIHDNLFLSEYDDLGNIKDGEAIDDPKGIYASLTKNELSVVEVHRYQQDVQHLKDLITLTVTNNDPTKTFLDLLREGTGPELATMIYNNVVMAIRPPRNIP